jgi:large subunit ribosomal protein L21
MALSEVPRPERSLAKVRIYQGAAPKGAQTKQEVKTMFAVIKTGGKQYRVAANDKISIEKLPGEPGDQILFEDVLMVGNAESTTIGAPIVDGASVAGEVIEQTRARKIIVFKKKRRKNYRRTQGHRQHLTTVRITEILTGGAKPSPKKAEKPAAEKKAAAKPAAEKKPAAKTSQAKPAAKKAAAKDSKDKPAKTPAKKAADKAKKD